MLFTEIRMLMPVARVPVYTSFLRLDDFPKMSIIKSFLRDMRTFEAELCTNMIAIEDEGVLSDYTHAAKLVNSMVCKHMRSLYSNGLPQHHSYRFKNIKENKACVISRNTMFLIDWLLDDIKGAVKEEFVEIVREKTTEEGTVKKFTEKFKVRYYAEYFLQQVDGLHKMIFETVPVQRKFYDAVPKFSKRGEVRKVKFNINQRKRKNDEVKKENEEKPKYMRKLEF